MICTRCNEPIAYGESHATLYDAGGQISYVHVVVVCGVLMEHCPQPEPVAEGDPDLQEVG